MYVTSTSQKDKGKKKEKREEKGLGGGKIKASRPTQHIILLIYHLNIVKLSSKVPFLISKFIK